MDGKFHFIVFLLLFRYAICRKCNCKSVDILQSIVQREMMAREMLVSRVEMLESKLALGTNNDPIASGHSSDTVVLERLSVLESMMENFNTKLIEISTERRRVARLSHALTEAWKIHKYGSSVMNENIQNSIDENNKRFNQLTLEVDKHMEVVDSKVELLMNETNKLVTKQLKTVEDGFEVVRSGLNKTFEDYTAQINEDFTELVDKTDSRLIKIMRNECASDPCKNGATCVDGINSFTCICMTGYSGSHCQIDIDECSSNPCFNGATCVDGINSYLCRCQDGYMYEDRFCKDIDECLNGPCMNGATCVDGINNYICQCLTGYEGEQCQLDIDECFNRPCMNGATCVDGINNFTCQCLTGYEGEQCQLDINECANNPCKNGATCVDGIGSYSCRCLPGYEGIYCQEDIDECSSAPCLNGGTCHDGINDYYCRCVRLNDYEYYRGKNCETYCFVFLC